MAEYTIDKFSYGGNTYKLQDNVSGYVTAAGAASAAPVQSVNGQTDAVVLDAEDVGAIEERTVTLTQDARTIPNTWTVDKTYDELSDYSSYIIRIQQIYIRSNGTVSQNGNFKGLCAYDGLNDRYIVCGYDLITDDLTGLGAIHLWNAVAVDYYDQPQYLFSNKIIDLENAIDDVRVNDVSIVSNKIANIVTNTAYNASTNKIATMTDINNAMTVVTFTPDGTNNNLIISVQNPSSITNGNEVSY